MTTDLVIVLFSVIGSLIPFGLWIFWARLVDGVWTWN